MKKNGFVFVETIVVIVILASALLLLYTSFSNVLQAEKTRVYYDDVAYIYRTHYLKKQLDGLNFEKILEDLKNDENIYFKTLGIDSPKLFEEHQEEKTLVANMLKDYDVLQMIVLKENKLDNLKRCTEECSLDKNCPEYENCNNLFMSLSTEMLDYLKTVFVDLECTYILVSEYQTCDKDTNCKNYYSWVSV